ncbi:hypothetical protein [Photobacterium phosphoreum]|uniref:hypothetical protein n=1 Tax=Photobacterium phosphoreum TaxID=659 RepID=UPI0039B075A0
MSIQLTTMQSAMNILLNAKDYEEDQSLKRSSRTINLRRFELSERTMRVMCCRDRLSRHFIEDLSSVFYELGWYMISTGEASFLFLRINATDNWPRLGARLRFSENNELFNDVIEAAEDGSNLKLRRAMRSIRRIVNDMIDENTNY